MLNCRLIQSEIGLIEIADDWDNLLARSEFDDIFLSSGFAIAWWHAYGHGKMLQVGTVEDGSGRLRLVAPFFSETKYPGRWRLLGMTRADYSNLVVEQGDQAAVKAFLAWLGKQAGWREIQIRKVPAQATFLSCLRARYFSNSKQTEKLWAWADVLYPLAMIRLHKDHPYITRQDLVGYSNIWSNDHYRKHLNWFSRQGALEYECFTEVDEIRRILPEFFALHIRQWQENGGNSIFLDAENRDFYFFLLDQVDKYHALSMDILKFDGEIIAAHFGFEWQRRKYYYKPCYEPRYSTHSPGRLLFAHILQRAIQENIELIDLLYGREAYKDKFASGYLQTASLTLFHSRRDVVKRKFRRKASFDAENTTVSC